MKDLERDYPDHTLAPYFEHGDEPQCNTSDNPNFYEVMDARIGRRGFMMGGLASIAAGLFGAGMSVKDALAQSTAIDSLLGFKPVPVSTGDTVVVPEGYRFQVLGAWGEPIAGDMPAFRPGANTGAEQAMQIGMHHDGIHFFPLDGSSEDGLIAVNHEYIEPRFLHAEKYKGLELDSSAVVYDADGKRDDDDVLKEVAAHGVSIYRTSKQPDGTWAIVADPRNRRIHGLTEMEIGGPVRGSAHVVTKFSPDGTKTRGTLNNCAHGVTPWNTYMAAEENWAGYFANTDKIDQKPDLPREHARYGVSTDPRGGRYGWHLARSGADEYARFDASTKGASATEDYRNEPNTFGWMVEIDPFDPNSMPVKRTALGRFAHEGVVFAPAVEGAPVVCYSGDDARFEYIYKFVSDGVFILAQTDGSILDTGTLYVAKFNDDGTGEWLALAPGRNGLTPANGFADLADILVNTRLAADFVGATKMDRPEWGTIDPNSSEVYFTLTNNSRRTQAQVDAVNPRAENNYGQIVRWRYANGDHTKNAFEWDLFVIAGTPRQSATFAGQTLTDDNTFACPDGIWCDQNSRLWIQTDIGEDAQLKGPTASMGQNAMLAADPRTGEIRRFLTGPNGQEVTGVISTPDGKAMFVNFQHPGATATAERFAAGDMGSQWPDGPGSVPRSFTIVITREDGGVIGA
ncbi:PhoX family protein [Polymorphum gilvum]|uniref:Alkaline phosphatase family protein n=1 Tax=Polymorphum gilvum (strain LMG 25793 / CGMCC 1.9160 / SL003B-26A1) TaxID=991905 RepID=F2J3G2_POLGS|nr:PhoX family phosphatase [Polymorphum gilvum]ADZ70987.1 Alkaline phosphatase family protein [Polymorphum gilvum SL003B-26A1]